MPGLPRTRAPGCRHCISCAVNFSLWIDARYQREGPLEAGRALCELWPAGLSSPTVYYMVRERQLNWQIHTAAAHTDALWRQQPAPPAAAPLLRRRGVPPLSVRVPVTATGVDTADSVVYVRSIEPRCYSAFSPAAPTLAKAAPPAAILVPTPLRAVALPPVLPLEMAATWAPRASTAAPAPTTAAAKPAPLRLATPPALHEQVRSGVPPHKRSRLDTPPAAGNLPSHADAPAGMAACPPAPASCAPAALLAQQTSDAWVLIPQPAPRQQQQPRSQQQGGGDDPHGVLSWLRKIKSMLEQPAVPATVYC